ncbi:MAG: DMT family transporter [Acidiferrobacteraceae bacterium]
MNRTHRLSGTLFAIAGTLLFSTKAILVKIAYRGGGDASTLIALRMAFSAPFYAAVAWHLGRGRPPLAHADRAALSALGILGFYVSGLLDFRALTELPVDVERLLLYIYPTLVVLGSAMIQRRRVTKPERIALVLTYTGLALVVLSGTRVANAGYRWTGTAFVLAAAVTYAANLIGSQMLIQRVGAARSTANALLAASLAAVSVFLLQGGAERLHSIPPFLYADAAMLSLFATVLPSFLLAAGIARIGAPGAALVGTIGPIATVSLAWLVLGEPLHATQGLGGILILAGVYLATTTRPGRSATGSGLKTASAEVWPAQREPVPAPDPGAP